MNLGHLYFFHCFNIIWDGSFIVAGNGVISQVIPTKLGNWQVYLTFTCYHKSSRVWMTESLIIWDLNVILILQMQMLQTCSNDESKATVDSDLFSSINQHFKTCNNNFYWLQYLLHGRLVPMWLWFCFCFVEVFALPLYLQM